MKSRVKVLKQPIEAQKKLRELEKRLKGPLEVAVGLPKGSGDYPDGTSLIKVGIIHEFGSPSQGIPERSFLRASIRIHRKKYAKMMKKLGAKMLDPDSNMTPKRAMGLMGTEAVGDIKKRMSEGLEPGLSNPSKERLKGGTGTPLIDTSLLFQSITYQIKGQQPEKGVK